MDARRELILQLHKSGKRNCKIIRMLKSIAVYKRLVERVIARHRKSGRVEKWKSTGRKRTVRTAVNIKKIRERIRRNRQRSLRKLAADMKISKSSVHNIIHKDLGMKAYKKRKIHDLTEKQKQAGVRGMQKRNSCLAMKRYLCYRTTTIPTMIVYMQLVWPTYHYVRELSKRYQNASSVMVWGAVSKRGALPLLFVDKGVKITKDVYLETVLQHICFQMP